MHGVFIANEKRGRTMKAEIVQLLEGLRMLNIHGCESSKDALIFSLAFQHNLSACNAGLSRLGSSICCRHFSLG